MFGLRSRVSLLSLVLCFLGGFTVGSWFLAMVQLENNSPSQLHSTQTETSHLSLSLSEYQESVRRESQVLLAILIMSAPRNFELRDTLRSTWLKIGPDPSRNMVRHFFIIGTETLRESKPKLLRKLKQEQTTHQDLMLINDLKDSFHNLTSKLVKGIDALTSIVPFQYLLKCDDDSFVRVDILVSELHEREHNRHQERDYGVENTSPHDCYYWGFFDGRAKVLKKGKWKEPEYNLCDLYIPYALGGGYIISKDCTQFILKNQQILKKYVNEDVSLGLWLSVVSPERKHDTRFDTEYESRGCNNQYIVQHKLTINEMIERYQSLAETGHLCPNEFRRRPSYEYNWDTVPSQCCKRNSSLI